jgi:hypothetical protein
MNSISPTTDGAVFWRPSCPLCNSSTNRISRRLIALLTSIFVPVRRYRCRAMRCNWEGNLRTPPAASLPSERRD